MITMFRLKFNPSKIPRSTKREEWKEIWRWKRSAEKILKKEIERQVTNALLYGISHPEIFK